MNRYTRSLLLILLLLTTMITEAQQKEIPIRFANGDFISNSNISKNTFKKEDILAAATPVAYYLLLQFNVLPTRAQRDNLKKIGVELGAWLPGNAYLASVKPFFDFTLATSLNIRSVNLVPPAYKIDRRLLNYQATADRSTGHLFAVSYFASANKDLVRAALLNAGASIHYTKLESPGLFFIEANPAIINAVANLPFVISIGLQQLKDQPINYNGRALNAVSAVSAPNGKNLHGKGVAVGVGDNADISTHIDFTGRLINRSPWVPDVHGTHTAGTTAGAGIVNVKYQGMAPKATIINEYFSDIISNAPTYVTDYNMVLSNNSYHSELNGCPGDGSYDALSNYADNQLQSYSQLQHVFAAGNDGALSCSGLPLQFGTIKSGWQAAKDVLTVGALDQSTYNIAAFSSCGPLADGRIKPEIVSNGVNVISTYPYNAYGIDNGTSMSCPAVTGTLALFYERYRQSHGGSNPTAALIKAIACNTAEDLGNPGPDFKFGFGLINARRGVEAIDSGRYFINTIDNAGSINNTISIPANTRRVKILLYWADPAAATSAGSSLVNDLDLTVTEPSLTVHHPLILDPSAAGVLNNAVEGIDRVNNIEQVTIENPAAGTYTINVKGFNIPAGPQDYVLSYEIIPPAVTVEYPYGGEKFVPGETEFIRWNAYGNETNSFTVDYSIDNGTTWTTINNNVAASSKLLAWTVPATVSNSALVRVTRNGTGLSGKSSFNFSILGQPTLTATNACEGAVQLSWPAVAGATSYDILQLTADSMLVIGNTASLNYLVKGLNKNGGYWLGVAAKNGSISGRRSVSLNVLPTGGPCSLSIFNNDLKVDSILEPNSARQLFSDASKATQPVKIKIKNKGAVTVTGPYTVSFNYGGGTITETINTSLNAGDSLTYVFSGTYPIPAAGYLYNFKSWVTYSLDSNHVNDTAYKTVKYINNDPITVLPLTEGFESMPAGSWTANELAIGSNKYLDFSQNRKGRARTFVNTGMAYAGNQALTLDQSPSDPVPTTDSAVLNYNMSQFTAGQLRFDFYYKNHGQADSSGNRVWIRGSENDPWIEAYNLYANQAALGDWSKGVININDLLGSANPAQNVSATFQIKFGEEGNTSANAVNPVQDLDDGYTFDNLNLSQAINDVALAAINAPSMGDCALSATNPVSVKIKNYNNAVLSNLQVSYQINGGTVVTETIPSLGANQVLDYVFTKKADLSAYIDYNINVWVKYAGDNYPANDSILNYSIHNSKLISSYPYLESFETSDGGFYAKGTNSSWQWGTPNKSVINRAPDGTKAWVTSLTGSYNINETSYLISPCFDLTGLRNPVLSFSHIYQVEQGFDYTWVEYTTDGINWIKLGAAGSGTNWYDNPTLNNWNLSKTFWHVASIDVPVKASAVRFRFVMSSDAGVTYDGVGIDEVHVHEKTLIANYVPAVPTVTAAVSGSNWIPFNWGDSVNGPWYVLAEINPNGQNLGTVSIRPYLDSSNNVRNSNNQYYASRNYVIHSTNSPSGNIGVRLYFTDTEANALINAGNCNTCGNPTDAYQLGVEKYHGTAAEENGILEDNYYHYQFILPANSSKVPHSNGYYAEFSVADLSEFWFCMGDIAPVSGSTCPGSTIVFTAPAGGSSYQWQLDNGSGYTNISNGASYAGVTTNTLQVLNTPTAFAGNKYHCIVSGIAGTEYTLRFKNVWTGAVDSNWFNAANWLCGSVPDANTDVVIPGGLQFYPVLTANTNIRSILMKGATVPVIINANVNLNINSH